MPSARRRRSSISSAAAAAAAAAPLAAARALRAPPPAALSLYTGVVTHTRRVPAVHGFSYPIALLLLECHRRAAAEATPRWRRCRGWAPPRDEAATCARARPAGRGDAVRDAGRGLRARARATAPTATAAPCFC